jgi:hypothetical protein
MHGVGNAELLKGCNVATDWLFVLLDMNIY